MEPQFETEKYRFLFKENRLSISIEIRRVSGEDVTDEDKCELRDFFEDIGKWETFTKSVMNVLKGLGINIEISERYEKEFGREKYTIDLELWRIAEENIIVGTINLSPEECLRRTEGKERRMKLTIDEALEQVKNIPKWKTLIKTISALRLSLKAKT